jgi:hypothetical protein
VIGGKHRVCASCQSIVACGVSGSGALRSQWFICSMPSQRAFIA